MTALLASGALQLAVEVPAEHIAARLAVPLGFLFFSGSVYLLLWSIYGAKKGALIYGVAFFSVAALIGVFWWFGAPGSPPATGVRYLPGQEADRYVPRWYAMEPGSERAEYFESTNDLEMLQTPEEYLGMEGMAQEDRQRRPAYRELLGDLDTAVSQMVEFYLPLTDGGTPLIGAERRGEMMEAAGEPPEGLERDTPFLTARAKEHPDDPMRPDARVGEDRGLRVIGAELEVVATFVGFDPDTEEPLRDEVIVEEAVWFAFQDPGALWFPSAVWTLVSLVLFAACLFGLDLTEKRERRTLAEREPVRV
jgi:uncharacterized membrane protein